VASGSLAPGTLYRTPSAEHACAHHRADEKERAALRAHASRAYRYDMSLKGPSGGTNETTWSRSHRAMLSTDPARAYVLGPRPLVLWRTQSTKKGHGPDTRMQTHVVHDARIGKEQGQVGHPWSRVRMRFRGPFPSPTHARTHARMHARTHRTVCSCTAARPGSRWPRFARSWDAACPCIS
jgi:hypothetical protein